MKNCSHCQTSKPLTDFYRNSRYGRSAWCKECHRALSREQALKGYFRARRAKLNPAGRKTLTPIQRIAYATWSNTKKRSFRNGKPFDLELHDVEALITEFCETHYAVLGQRSPFQPSLDRINETGGYTKANVRVVWLMENYARNGFTDEQLIEFCKRKLGLLA